MVFFKFFAAGLVTILFVYYMSYVCSLLVIKSKVFENFDVQIGTTYVWDQKEKKMAVLTGKNGSRGPFGPLSISEFVFYKPSAKPFGARSYVPDYLESICLARGN
jgi:hypothetical protein